MSSDREKQLAAEAAAELVADGMRVGLGTGSTVAYLLPALARRGLSLRCVATSLATEEAARGLGLAVESFSGAGCARTARRRDRRGRPGRAVGVGREGRRRRPHAREGGCRRCRAVRGHRLVGQARRAVGAAGAARAPRVRPRGDARAHRLRRAPRRAEEPRRRRHRRLHGAGRRSGGACGATVRDDRRRRARALPARPRLGRHHRSRRRGRPVAAFASRASRRALFSPRPRDGSRRETRPRCARAGSAPGAR